MPSRNPTVLRLQSQRYRETRPYKSQAGRKRVRTIYQRAWFAEHPAQRKRYSAKYRHWHQAELRERKRRWYLRNRARLLMKSRAHYEANREALLATSRAYQKRNKHRRRATNLRYRRKHLLRVRALHRAWAKKNYAKNRQAIIAQQIVRVAARRRLIRLGSVDDRKQAVLLISRLRAAPDTCCAYCGVSLVGKRIHIDHILPLSRGGKHCVENLCASCQTCNVSKGDRTPGEWREAQRGGLCGVP